MSSAGHAFDPDDLSLSEDSLKSIEFCNQCGRDHGQNERSSVRDFLSEELVVSGGIVKRFCFGRDVT